MHKMKNYWNTKNEIELIRLRLSLLEMYENKIQEEKISLKK